MAAPENSEPNERTRLLGEAPAKFGTARLNLDEATTMLDSQLGKERSLSISSVGERLPYNDYTTIDWLHDLVGFFFSHTPPHHPRSPS